MAAAEKGSGIDNLLCGKKNPNFPTHTVATQALIQSFPKLWSKAGLRKAGENHAAWCCREAGGKSISQCGCLKMCPIFLWPKIKNKPKMLPVIRVSSAYTGGPSSLKPGVLLLAAQWAGVRRWVSSLFKDGDGNSFVCCSVAGAFRKIRVRLCLRSRGVARITGNTVVT